MDQYLDSHISDVQSHVSRWLFRFQRKFENGTLHCRFAESLRVLLCGAAHAGPRGVPKKEGEATLHHENGLSELYVCVCIHCLFPINYFVKLGFLFNMALSSLSITTYMQFIVLYFI